MGEAMLVRKGGAALRGLTVISPPDRVDYFQGEYLDMAGTMVGAEFGTFTVPLHESAWTYSPTRALTPSDTAVTISATIGRLTKTATVPITVADYSRVLTENDWETIAYVAAMGRANQVWSIGDIKTTDYGSWRIIGFDADPLDTADAKYNDTTYNANKKKAAITFQWVAPAGVDTMNLSYTNVGGWLSSNMNTTILPNLLGTLPDDMTAVMRLVDKYTCIGGSHTADRDVYNTAANKLFLLAANEVFATVDGAAPVEAEMCAQYAWYANIANPYKGGNMVEWLRSPHDPRSCTSAAHFIGIATSGNRAWYDANRVHGYYPAFCI